MKLSSGVYFFSSPSTQQTNLVGPLLLECEFLCLFEQFFIKNSLRSSFRLNISEGGLKFKKYPPMTLQEKYNLYRTYHLPGFNIFSRQSTQLELCQMLTVDKTVDKKNCRYRHCLLFLINF